MPLDHHPLPPLTDASVAVLPLDNLSGDPRDSHLCKGIAGDIITNLSRFRDLLVIARHSAFLLKNLNVANAEIGRRLGVRYLLTGALQRSGSRIRFQATLTEAASGHVVWSDRHLGDLGDVFAFQDEVADLVTARLAVRIRDAERRRLSAHPPAVLVYGLNLRGQELSLKYEKDANRQARRLFERAIKIDPEYGRSYAGLSRSFNLDAFYAWAESPESALDRALSLAKIATLHDSHDARGFAELGYAYLYGKRHAESLAAYERAVALNANDADVLSEMADALAYADQAERALDLLARAMRLNPLYPDDYLWHLADAHFILSDYEQAIEALHRMQDQSEAHRLLAACHALLGNRADARRHAEEVLRIHPNFSIGHWGEAAPHKQDAPQRQIFIDGLRLAGLR
ncbi:MAG: hypothetical protein QNJ30_16635 [Kiloniellales bacterium]|nr:hypothetical protein [Kiloniellales bacterium]